jgi:hypothetical protein
MYDFDQVYLKVIFADVCKVYVYRFSGFEYIKQIFI